MAKGDPYCVIYINKKNFWLIKCLPTKYTKKCFISGILIEPQLGLTWTLIGLNLSVALDSWDGCMSFAVSVGNSVLWRQIEKSSITNHAILKANLLPWSIRKRAPVKKKIIGPLPISTSHMWLNWFYFFWAHC